MDDERLISLVEERPVLFDKAHPKYSSTDFVRKKWEEIGEEMNENVEALKKRWVYLRDYFKKQNRSLESSKSGQAATKRRKWSLFDQMLFLIPYQTPTETSGSLDSLDDGGSQLDTENGSITNLLVNNAIRGTRCLQTNDKDECKSWISALPNANLTVERITKHVGVDEKMAIFYIGAYVASKHKELSAQSDNVLDEAKAYFNVINRKSLTKPLESFLLFVLICSYYFTHSKETFCRKKLVSIFSMFPSFFSIDITIPNRALQRIADILLNTFRKKYNQEAQEVERQRKRSKLMSQSTASGSKSV